MTDKYDGGPAFGHAAYSVQDDFTGHPGMSLRDWYAGMALQGMCAYCGTNMLGGHLGTDTEIGVKAFIIADAMIEAREK